MSYFTPAGDPKLFRCSCGRAACDAPAPSPMLLSKLEMLRVRVDRPVRVTSGPRCAVWNKRQGGKPTSEHLTGEGADLEVRSSRERAELLEMIYRAPGLFSRAGIGRDFIHVGVSVTHDQRVAWVYYTGPVAKAAAPKKEVPS